jgi:Tfp pilus assembly protein PilO
MKKLIATTLSILVGISLLYFFFLISPLIQLKGEYKDSYAQAQTRLTEFRSMLLEFPEHFAMGTEAHEKREIITAQLYSKEDILKLFSNIEKRALDLNLNLLEVTPSIEELLALNEQQASNNNLPRQLDIIVRLNGEYRDLGEYIHSIESEGFFQGVNFCKVRGSASGTAFPEMSLGFRAVLGLTKES